MKKKNVIVSNISILQREKARGKDALVNNRAASNCHAAFAAPIAAIAARKAHHS